MKPRSAGQLHVRGRMRTLHRERSIPASEDKNLSDLADIRKDIEALPADSERERMLSDSDKLADLYRESIKFDAEVAQWKEELESRAKVDRRYAIYGFLFLLLGGVLLTPSVIDALKTGATQVKNRMVLRDVEPLLFWLDVIGKSSPILIGLMLIFFALLYWWNRQGKGR